METKTITRTRLEALVNAWAQETILDHPLDHKCLRCKAAKARQRQQPAIANLLHAGRQYGAASGEHNRLLHAGIFEDCQDASCDLRRAYVLREYTAAMEGRGFTLAQIQHPEDVE